VGFKMSSEAKKKCVKTSDGMEEIRNICARFQ
jgi:hypothetical protein